MEYLPFESWQMADLTMGFIGAGTLGNGMALALLSAGYRVVAVSSRNYGSAERLAGRIPNCEAVAEARMVAAKCDLVFITTPDDAIAQVVSQVAWHSGQGVVHCSGVHSLEVLEGAARGGADTGSFHPFQTLACLATAEQAVERLAGSTFLVDGHGTLLEHLEEIASRLGGRSIQLDPQYRALYHASAVLSCGHLVALLGAATRIWEEMGVPAAEALQILLPLASATIGNVARVGLDDSATGPVVRGDVESLQMHLESLEHKLPQLIPLYCNLSLESAAMAQSRLRPDVQQRMGELLENAAARHHQAQ